MLFAVRYLEASSLMPHYFNTKEYTYCKQSDKNAHFCRQKVICLELASWLSHAWILPQGLAISDLLRQRCEPITNTKQLISTF